MPDAVVLTFFFIPSAYLRERIEERQALLYTIELYLLCLLLYFSTLMLYFFHTFQNTYNPSFTPSSFTFLSKSEAKIKLFNRSLVAENTSCFVPSHSFFP